MNDGFSKKYKTHMVVYCEEFNNISDAIAREKQLKHWSRAKKEKLINASNPEWIDLSKE
jgi:putative endonuclease